MLPLILSLSLTVDVPIPTFPFPKYDTVGVIVRLFAHVTAFHGTQIDAALIAILPSTPSLLMVIEAAHPLASYAPLV
jgi:hypothetical protein